MPRKKQIRSVYVTKEPDWKTLKLITDPEEREKAFRSCEYFVRTEINKTKGLPVVKEWIKTGPTTFLLFLFDVEVFP